MAYLYSAIQAGTDGWKRPILGMGCVERGMGCVERGIDKMPVRVTETSAPFRLADEAELAKRVVAFCGV
jgi:hypothetical protein